MEQFFSHHFYTNFTYLCRLCLVNAHNHSHTIIGQLVAST